MKFKALTAVAALMVAMPAITLADPDDDTLVLNGETEMVTKAAAPAHMAETGIDTVMSGWHFRNDDTQAMQADDFDNPGMLAVESAIEAWNTVEGEAGKSCASCHGAAEDSMKGIRAVYPKWWDTATRLSYGSTIRAPIPNGPPTLCPLMVTAVAPTSDRSTGT